MPSCTMAMVLSTSVLQYCHLVLYTSVSVSLHVYGHQISILSMLVLRIAELFEGSLLPLYACSWIRQPC